MSKKVRIPTPLRKLTNNEELVEVDASNIGDAIKELQTRFKGIGQRLIDDKRKVRLSVHAQANEHYIHYP